MIMSNYVLNFVFYRYCSIKKSTKTAKSRNINQTGCCIKNKKIIRTVFRLLTLRKTILPYAAARKCEKIFFLCV